MQRNQGANLDKAADNVGVGISFRLESSGAFSVVRIVEGCPSDGQGIEQGDKLISVNDQLVQGLSFEELASVLSGPRGSRVSLQFARRDYLHGKMQMINVETSREGPKVGAGSGAKLKDQDKIWNSSAAPPNIMTPLPPVESPILIPPQPMVVEDPTVYDDFDIPLTRVQLPGSPMPLGAQQEVGIGVKFSLPDPDGFGIISDMYSGAAADNSGQVRPGDIIWKVNGVDMKGRKRADIIKACAGPVGSTMVLTVLRKREHNQPSAPPPLDMSSYSIPNSPPPPTLMPQFADQPVIQTKGTYPNLPGSKTVTLDRVILPDQDPNGPSSGNVGIVWSRAPHQKDPVVQFMVSNSPAERSGQIQVGDRLHSIDGVPVEYRTPTQVFDMTAGPPGTKVDLTFLGTDPALTASQRVQPNKPREPQVTVWSNDTTEELSYKVRLHKIFRMGDDGVLDAVMVWLVHLLIGAALFLFLTVHDYIDVDWNLSKNHFGDDQPESLKGPYLYALSPMAGIVALFLVTCCVYLGINSSHNKLVSSFLFGKRAGLFCVSLWGNFFVAGSVVLLYLYASRLSCCMWIADLEQGALVVMAPVSAGIILYFVWTGIELATIPSKTARRLRADLLPVSGIVRRGVLGLCFLVAELLLWLKIDDRIDDFSWWTASIGVHVFLALSLFLNLLGLLGDLGSTRNGAPSHLVLHIIGVIDSAAFEAVAIMVIGRMASMDWDADLYSPVCVTAVAFLVAAHTILFAWSIFQACVGQRNKTTPPEARWLFPKVTKVIDPQTPPKMNLNVVWAAPTSADGHTPFDKFKIEQVPVPLGYNGKPDTYEKKELPWRSAWSGKETMGHLEGLDGSGEYLLRVCGQWNNNNRLANGPIIYVKVPQSKAPPVPPPVHNDPLSVKTVPLQPQVQALPVQLPMEPSPSKEVAINPVPYASANGPPVIDIIPMHEVQVQVQDDADKTASRASKFPTTIPGPLVLNDLKLAGGGSPFLYGLFEWVPQQHFGANILDLQLIQAGDGSEGHDYTTVYAGLDNNVRVYNLLPNSKYRMRLRAGDFENGDLKTVVERCVLPFETPSVKDLVTGDNQSPVVRANVYDGTNGAIPSFKHTDARDTAQLQAHFEHRLKELRKENGAPGPAEPAGNTLINPRTSHHPGVNGNRPVHQSYDHARPTALFASQPQGPNYSTSYSPVFM